MILPPLAPFTLFSNNPISSLTLQPPSPTITSQPPPASTVYPPSPTISRNLHIRPTTPPPHPRIRPLSVPPLRGTNVRTPPEHDTIPSPTGSSMGLLSLAMPHSNGSSAASTHRDYRTENSESSLTANVETTWAGDSSTYDVDNDTYTYTLTYGDADNVDNADTIGRSESEGWSEEEEQLVPKRKRLLQRGREKEKELDKEGEKGGSTEKGDESPKTGEITPKEGEGREDISLVMEEDDRRAESKPNTRTEESAIATVHMNGSFSGIVNNGRDSDDKANAQEPTTTTTTTATIISEDESREGDFKEINDVKIEEQETEAKDITHNSDDSNEEINNNNNNNNNTNDNNGTSSCDAIKLNGDNDANNSNDNHGGDNKIDNGDSSVSLPPEEEVTCQVCYDDFPKSETYLLR